MTDRPIDVFFYGLFMDEEVLRAKGLHPHSPRKAVAPGYRLRIAQRAMLLPEVGSQAFGMVFKLTDQELKSLYAEPGLEMYRSVSLNVSFDDGSLSMVTTFNLRDTKMAGRPNVEYAAKLRSVFERLGFPADCVNAAVEEDRVEF